VYDIREADAVLDYITAEIVSALDIVALEKEIRVKNGPNLDPHTGDVGGDEEA
jgi:hypothetical protein